MSKEFEQAFKKITGVAPADGAGCNNPNQPCEWLAEELYEAGKAAGRALGRREMKKEVKKIMHDADMAHVEYEDSWYQAKDAIEAIPEEV